MARSPRLTVGPGGGISLLRHLPQKTTGGAVPSRSQKGEAKAGGQERGMTRRFRALAAALAEGGAWFPAPMLQFLTLL